MATATVQLTESATNLTDEASFVAGNYYWLQAQGGAVFLYEGTAAPADLSAALSLFDRGGIGIRQSRTGGVNWYAWAERSSARLIINAWEK